MLLAISECPTRETTKKPYTIQELIVAGKRDDTGRTGSRIC